MLDLSTSYRLPYIHNQVTAVSLHAALYLSVSDFTSSSSPHTLHISYIPCLLGASGILCCTLFDAGVSGGASKWLLRHSLVSQPSQSGAFSTLSGLVTHFMRQLVYTFSSAHVFCIGQFGCSARRKDACLVQKQQQPPSRQCRHVTSERALTASENVRCKHSGSQSLCSTLLGLARPRSNRICKQAPRLYQLPPISGFLVSSRQMWGRKHSRCGVSRKLLDSTLCCYQCHGTGSRRRPSPSCCWPSSGIYWHNYWRSRTTRSAYDTRPYRQDFKEKTSLPYPYHITKANYNGQRDGRFQRHLGMVVE